jgi:signal transduction histidine kinase
MQQTNVTAGMDGAGRKRVEAVVETLATLGCRGESVAEVAHDARNMVTALGLYCDLLEEPGVLTAPFTHYGNELRLVAAASRRLVEKLVALDTKVDTRVDTRVGARADASLDRSLRAGPGASLGASLDASPDTSLGASLGASLDASPDTSLGASVDASLDASRSVGSPTGRSPVTAAPANLLERGLPQSRPHQAPGRWDLIPAAPISNLAAELVANRNLLAALAGPSIALTVDAEGGARGVRLTGEDLTRVLVNLVKNAAEAMPAGGHIQIGLRERPAAAGAGETLALTIEDSGPGVPGEVLEEIFASGYTTRTKDAQARESWPATHRGLGLSITRSIVEAAGGRILAANRVLRGARFEIDLPVRKTS